MPSTPDLNTKFLRFGLLCNGLTVEKWQAKTIKTLIEGGMQLILVVLNANETKKETFSEKLFSYKYSRLLFNLWSRFIFRPDSKNLIDISSITSKCTHISCKTQTAGIANIFDNQTIELIKNENLDFLLRFGFNIIKGEILQGAKYGVWSFHHDDEEIIRGGPPAFWEVFNPIDTNSVILQKLTDSLDKGLILKKIHFRTIKHSYNANLDQVYNGSTFMPLSVCKEIISGNMKETISLSKAKVIHPPGNFKMLFFFTKMVFRRIQFHLNALFRQEDWCVGIIDQPFQNIMQAIIDGKSDFQVNWLPKENKSTYTADPFIIEHQGDDLLFFELYDYKTDKGSVAMSKASEKFGKYYNVLDSENHFSFPFVFEIDSFLYCIPESYESNGIQLYRFDDQQNKFMFVQTLIDNVLAVDPVLFQYNDLWWLFFTQKEQPSVHLFAYFAENPFGPFSSHLNNPIKSDIFSSRPAGKPFIFNDKLIQPTQDCGHDYGMRVVLNEIIDLSKNSFKEATYKVLKPNHNWLYNKGLHTLNGNESYTVIDSKRFAFFWYGFKNRLLQRLKFKSK